jgi:ribose transport system ATP-binding protein
MTADVVNHSGVPPVLELSCISKSFPGVRALEDVSFAIRPGEVHMLLGENGAGKSSLMKVLCGAYLPDEGEFIVDGRKTVISSADQARCHGVAVIFQEFSLVPYLTIAQNIFLGREPAGKVRGTISRRNLVAQARVVLEAIGFDIDPNLTVASLGVAQQQMVEIAKAVSQNARILVMDEPTAALSERETQKLFALIAKLKRNGVAIVYISHRMEEVFALGDRITVLRDGRRVGEVIPSQTSPDALVGMMVGRSVSASYRREPSSTTGDVLLRVEQLSAPSGISGINLEVRRGEIVGLCGLVGSGRTEVLRAIFGADPIAGGRVLFEGREMKGNPEEATKYGMALIPESRKVEGLALSRSVAENLMLASLPRVFPTGWFAPRRAYALAQQLIERLRIATPNARQMVGVLSGGNQQKVVLGKWLNANSKLFMLDEPTRGIDVGAKAEIFALVDRLVASGTGILMVSSEQSEICNVCDRAYVMREGRIVGQLQRSELTEANIVKLGMHHG